MTPLWDFDEVVKALGGPSAVGRLTNNPASAVCGWRRTKKGAGGTARFPPKYYWLIKFALEEKGFYAPLDLFGFVGHFSKSA
jgi:hypothetical protein